MKKIIKKDVIIGLNLHIIIDIIKAFEEKIHEHKTFQI